MPSAQVKHHSLKLVIQKNFVMWLHAHSFIDNIGISKDDITYNKLWAKHPAEVELMFQGAFGNQFKTSGEAELFNEAYTNLMKRSGLADKHWANLLYITLINYIDTERQSLTYNTLIRLRDYAKFIIDLVFNCLKHLDEMLKDKRYVQVYNVFTREYIFVATDLVINRINALEDEDLLDSISDDIIRYDVINFYDMQLYVPLSFSFHIADNSKEFKSIDGSKIPYVTLPNQFRHELLKYTIESMLKEHERYKTEFYYRMVNGSLPLIFYKDIYTQSYRKDVEGNQIKMVSIVLSDYLKKFTRISKPSAIAHFIFDLLCLLKGFKLPEDIDLPEDPNQLKSFYRKQGFSSEIVRQYIRD